jgi:adenine-specific DNA-methyltransferase
VRVAGPFTVESLSPHRMLGVDENDELIDPWEDRADYKRRAVLPADDPGKPQDCRRAAGAQGRPDQLHRAHPWPGDLRLRRRPLPGRRNAARSAPAIFIGPEFGTVQRADLVEAARECGDAGFDVLIACAFNYEAHATEFSKLGRIPVLKARMNADLHMAADLKNTGKGNLFVIFGEPDISLLPQDDGRLCIKVNGVDVFKPQTGEVISDSTDGIACWFIDTDYNQESFFVRHAYFLGANDPYKRTEDHAEGRDRPGSLGEP